MYSVKDLIPLLGPNDIVWGDDSRIFTSVADRERITEDSLDWISLRCPDPLDYLLSTKAKVVICPASLACVITDAIRTNKTLILTDSPNLLFARIARQLFVPDIVWGVHDSAIIDPGAKLGDQVSIAPLVVVGRAVIGNRTVIGSHVCIEDGVTIGDDVLIKSGARLGQGGFGFVRNELGQFEKFPQLGRLLIGNLVEIGSNTCIDRGSLSDTVIGSGVKISSLTLISHNVVIDEHTFIGSGVVIAGSASIGAHSWISPAVTIRDNVHVGAYSFVGMGSVVTRDVPDHELWYGVPAKFRRAL